MKLSTQLLPFTSAEETAFKNDFILESQNIKSFYFFSSISTIGLLPIFLIEFEMNWKDVFIAYMVISLLIFVSFIIQYFYRVRELSKILKKGKKNFEINFNCERKEISGELSEIEKYGYRLKFIEHENYNVVLLRHDWQYQFQINTNEKFQIALSIKNPSLFFLYKNFALFQSHEIRPDVASYFINA